MQRWANVCKPGIKLIFIEFMSSPLPTCPTCHSSNVVKNGSIHNGKQNHKCKECGRQFVRDPQNKIIDEVTKRWIDKLLLEKIPLAGIARVAEVSEVWLQQYVNAKYAQVERQVKVSAQKKGA
jgi:transposase-like protein